MIQEFVYVVDCEDGSVAKQVHDKAKILARNKSCLLDCHPAWDHEKKSLLVALRISGTDQWKCSAYARNIATFLLARHGLLTKFKPLTPVSVKTETNRRGLTLDEGRTVRDYPDRSTRARRRSESRAGQTPGSAEAVSP